MCVWYQCLSTSGLCSTALHTPNPTLTKTNPASLQHAQHPFWNSSISYQYTLPKLSSLLPTMSTSNTSPYPLSTDDLWARGQYYRFRIAQAFAGDHYRLLLEHERLRDHLWGIGEQTASRRADVLVQNLEREHNVLQAILQRLWVAYLHASLNSSLPYIYYTWNQGWATIRFFFGPDIFL
jgi:hypothetical protein